jgi:hypothetical protein
MAQSTFYDDYTDIIHYEHFFMLKIEEIDTHNEIDTTCFIVYDHDDEMFYLYGSRKNSEFAKHCIYQKSFYYLKDLYNFLKVVMNLDKHNTNVIVYEVPYATSEADYDTFMKACNGRHEITGYDNLDISKYNMFSKFISTLL